MEVICPIANVALVGTITITIVVTGRVVKKLGVLFSNVSSAVSEALRRSLKLQEVPC